MNVIFPAEVMFVHMIISYMNLMAVSRSFYRASRWSEKSQEAWGTPPEPRLSVPQDDGRLGSTGSVRPLHHRIPPAHDGYAHMMSPIQSLRQVRIVSSTTSDAQIFNYYIPTIFRIKQSSYKSFSSVL